MKNKVVLLSGVLILISLVVSACLGATSSGHYQCGETICVEIELATPIQLNQPTDVTIIINTEIDMNDVHVGLETDDPDAVLGQDTWTVNVTANQPLSLMTTVTFAEEQYYRLLVGAYGTSESAWNGIRVHVTQAGATLNPPDPHTPGVPAQGGSDIYPAYDPTPIPPQPTAWDRSLLPLTPQQVMSNCGWSSGSPVTTWTDAKVAVDIPETVSLNQDVSVTVSFEMPEGQPQNGTVQIKICPPTQAPFQIIGTAQWTTTLSPGGVFTANTTVRFTQAGVQALPVGAYASAISQVVNGGQQVQVDTSPSIANPNGWVKVLFEGFENRWPGTGWTVVDNSADGRNRFWDDDNLRNNGGRWAAWPANGGQHGIPAPTNTSRYFSNMDTRMVYGPFNFTDAELANVTFDLWYKTEANDDFLALEISLNGSTFTELRRWSGTQTSWTNQQIDLISYAGESTSVWLAWRFVSDSDANVFEGMWVDNIEIWKYVAGTVTISGKIDYYDKSDVLTSTYTTVFLWDADVYTADDLKAETTTNAQGEFVFPAIYNWDYDDGALDQLDLYLIWDTSFDDMNNTRATTNFQGEPYEWASDTYWNIDDGNQIINGHILANDPAEGAMWIFQEMWQGWNTVYTNTSTDPGPSTAVWKFDEDCFSGICNSFFTPATGIFISDFRIMVDDVPHEQGHNYMYNATGDYWFDPLCWYHDVYSWETNECAYTEGWATFFALAVRGDEYYHIPGATYNLETHANAPSDPPTGDNVEGWVAGALYDLLDNVNDGYDQADFTFDDIWDIMITTDPDSYWGFDGYWNDWKEFYTPSLGGENHYAVQAIYQNTIDYNTLAFIDIDNIVAFPQDFPLEHVIYLPDYFVDEESLPEQMTWNLDLSNFNETDCGATLDGYYLNLILYNAQFQNASCGDVRVVVSDGIEVVEDSFNVFVLRLEGRIYLPILRDAVVGDNPYPPPPTPGPTPTLPPYP